MKLYMAAGAIGLLLVVGVVTYSPTGETSGQQTIEALETRSSHDGLEFAGRETAPLTVAVPGAAEVPGDGRSGQSNEAVPAKTVAVEAEGASGDDGTTPQDAVDDVATAQAEAGRAAEADETIGRSNPGADVFEPLRNNKPEFSRYRDVRSVDLPMGSLTSGGAGRPVPNPISGQFRMHCEYSHFSYDDPIVYPGDPGKSHLHMFFGNTEADAFSTSESLFDLGGGSCNGYELDRSAYWVPALMSGTTETIVPYEILLYFKTHSPDSVQTFPKGLRVIAGASPTDPDGATRYRWKCENSVNRAAGTFEPINDGPFYDTIPDCRALGFETLGFMIDFPFCWDGQNLDSADHRSHMAYGCSDSHPVVFPQLQYIVHYNAPPSNAGIHLSSDPVDCQTGARADCGFTLHGDWWNAWHEQTNATWINECSRKRVVCQVPAISATTNLVGPGTFDGDPVLQLPAGSYVPGHN